MIKSSSGKLRASRLLVLLSPMTGHFTDAAYSQSVCAEQVLASLTRWSALDVLCTVHMYVLVSSPGERMLRFRYGHADHGLI